MLESINGFIWGNGLIFLLLFTGALYTVKLKFIQLRMFPYMLKKAAGGRIKGPQLRTVCMSLGTAMGTGNITGVASAIAIGGAGAVFWMWVSAFFGMAAVYAENVLSAEFSDEESHGPMAYIGKGLGCRRLSLFFAVCCIFAAFGMGGTVQISSMTESIRECADISPYLIAAAAFAGIFSVVSGGADRIGKAAQFLLPLATLVYSLICIILILRSRSELSSVMGRIFREALGIRQAAGGIGGYGISRAVSAGIRRGVFSNEAGLGSSPILHSSAQKSSSGKLQGMCGMFEVFTDTMICCTLTAVTILCCSSDGTVTGALSCVTGEKAAFLLAPVMIIFAFCTVVGWYYCGETAFRYIFPDGSAKRFAFLFAAVSALGAVIRAESVWILSDIFNGMMAFPNLLGLILLIKHVRTE